MTYKQDTPIIEQHVVQPGQTVKINAKNNVTQTKDQANRATALAFANAIIAKLKLGDVAANLLIDDIPFPVKFRLFTAANETIFACVSKKRPHDDTYSVIKTEVTPFIQNNRTVSDLIETHREKLTELLITFLLPYITTDPLCEIIFP